jgi:alpha-tubulin suppressor-like RCC1 family protein
MITIRQRGRVQIFALVLIIACGDSTGPAPTPTQLNLVTQASGAASGSAFSVQPVVEIRDSRGSRATNSVAGVTMTVSSGATVIGSATVNAVAGVAMFSDVGLAGVAGSYTLSFAAADLAGASQEISLGAGRPTQLAITTSAAGSASGAPFSTQPRVEVRDSVGNRVTGSTATVTMTVSSGATVIGSATVNAVAGVAMFSDVGLAGVAGSYTLSFAAADLAGASQEISLGAGRPTQLAITTSAAGSASGAPFSTQPRVEVRDSVGNRVTDSTAAVTMTVSSGATVIGGATVNAVEGVATFASAGLSGLVGDYSLTFATTGLASASHPITLTPGAPAQLFISTQPAGAVGGAPFAIQPDVQIRDAHGNLTSSTASVRATLASANGALLGTVAVAAVAGVATFTDLRIDFAAEHVLQFTTDGPVTGTSSTLTVTDPPGRRWKTTVTGTRSCGVTLDGELYCWGRSFLGDGTDASRSTPTRVAGTQQYMGPVAETAHCAITSGGVAQCWGWNSYAVLGVGDQSSTPRAVPTAVNIDVRFQSISAGNTDVCALAVDWTAYCWGRGQFGQQGNGLIGLSAMQYSPAPVRRGLAYRSITVGGSHACALTAAGTAYCWGAGGWGQLGDGFGWGGLYVTDRRVSEPQQILGHTFVEIAAGASHTCALKSSGVAYCWGSNQYGATGDGTTYSILSPRNTPAPVAGGVSFNRLVTGKTRTCGRSGMDIWYCWGENTDGMLAPGGPGVINVPTLLPTYGFRFESLAIGSSFAGDYHNFCGITYASVLFCWGDNSDGQLGQGSTSGVIRTPMLVR